MKEGQSKMTTPDYMTQNISPRNMLVDTSTILVHIVASACAALLHTLLSHQRATKDTYKHVYIYI